MGKVSFKSGAFIIVLYESIVIIGSGVGAGSVIRAGVGFSKDFSFFLLFWASIWSKSLCLVGSFNGIC